MNTQTKVFEYQENGLSYTVTIYELDGAFFADITVNDGAMDVNAIYFGDDDFSGRSAGLKGPLNMNGASKFEGETVQWDQAVKLSDPGLGRAGTDKDTYVAEGETLTVPLSITSLDDIEFFGIRATSTTTPEGSIKGVSGNPETHEEPEEPEEPVEPTFEKVFFAYSFGESGVPDVGFPILAEAPDPNIFNTPALPEGTEPTFENYLSYFETIGGDVTQVESVLFYEFDADGIPQVIFQIDAPEGGFADADALLEAYDDGMESMDFMAAISIESPSESDAFEDGDEDIPEAWTM